MKQPLNTHLHPYHLGASLYMPATRTDIWQIINRQKLSDIDSIIICLEDAVHSRDLPIALTHLKQLLEIWSKNQPIDDNDTENGRNSRNDGNSDNSGNNKNDRPLVFIRPRHPQMLMQLTQWSHIGLVDGFVLAKFDLDSLASWQSACEHLCDHHLLMPTLETAQIFNPHHNFALSDALTDAFRQSILALRIGGNDLFSCLRMRRPNDMTMYQTPLATVIYQLLGCFVPKGYALSAPVFEYMDKPELLAQELRHDVMLGLAGKTIIHPNQIALVKQAMMTTETEVMQAKAVLDTQAQAVFKQDNAMLEPATHQAWAEQLLIRHEIFGSRDEVRDY